MEAKSFVLRHDGLVREIITTADLQNPETGNVETVSALWDTGVTCSVITEQIAEKLGLDAVGLTEMGHTNGYAEVGVYIVSVRLPNGQIVDGIKAISCKPIHHFDMIIGMDIIGLCDFALTAPDGKTVFALRTPSMAEIDFTE
jgi:predicted aspartyl protease